MIDKAVIYGFGKAWSARYNGDAMAQMRLAARHGWILEDEASAVRQAFRCLAKSRDFRGRFTKRPA